MNKKKLLDAPTEDCWGFYGTIQNNEDLNEQDATSVWNQVFAILQNASWKPTDIAIRNFLRGRFGRHFADATTFYEGSLEKRIQQTASEKWVRKEFQNLKKDGFDNKLFDDDE